YGMLTGPLSGRSFISAPRLRTMVAPTRAVDFGRYALTLTLFTRESAMSNVKRWRSRSVLAGAIAGVVVSLASTAAADFTADFPAGLACTFNLRIEGQGGNQIQRDFLDKNGDLVRSISAGTGSALIFTNLDTGATLSLKSNGSVTNITYHSD